MENMENIWKPRPRKNRGGKVPFGYERDPVNPSMLLPISKDLDALQEIKDLVVSQAISLREGSQWIEQKTGKTLSYQGLKDRIDHWSDHISENDIEMNLYG